MITKEPRKGIHVALALALLGAALLSGCSSLSGGRRWANPVTVTEITAMSQHGVAPQTIIEKMNRAGTVYNMTDNQYEQLRGLGVTPMVIDYMRKTYSQAVEEHPWLANDDNLECWYMGYDGVWYGGGPWGFHPDC